MKLGRTSILLVTEANEAFGLVSSALALGNYSLVRSHSPVEVISLSSENRFSAVIFDLRHFRGDAFDVAAQIRRHGRSEFTSLVFWGPYSDRPFDLSLHEKGFVDFIDDRIELPLMGSRLKALAEISDLRFHNELMLEVVKKAEEQSVAKELAQFQINSLRREREVQQRYRDLVESLEHAIIWSVDALHLNFTFVSPSARKITGYGLREWSEEPRFWVKHVHPDDAEILIKSFDSLDLNQEKLVEHRFIAKSGAVLWFQSSFKLMMRADGTSAEIRGVSVDITARRESEDERQNLISLVESTSDFVGVSDPEHRATYVNQAGRNLLGIESDEITRQTPVLEYFPEFERERVKNEIAPCLLKSGSWTGEIFFRHFKTGENIPVFWNASAIRDSKTGKIVAFASIARDIRERRRDEERKTFIAEVTKAVSSSLDIGATLKTLVTMIVPRLGDWCTVHLTEGPGTVSLVAAHHTDSFKISSIKELNHTSKEGFFSKRVIDCVLESETSELITGITHEDIGEKFADSRQGKLVASLGLQSLIAVPLSHRGRIFGVLTLYSAAKDFSGEDAEFIEEIGRRSGMAIDNAMLFREAERAIQTRDEFLSIASHELKTPLTPLKLHFESLLRLIQQGRIHELPADKIVNILARADRQIDRITNLVDNLLDVSRINLGDLALKRESTDLSKIALDVADQFKAELEASKCELTLDLHGSLEGLWDPFKIEQVVINLLSNALKYGRGRPIAMKTRKLGQRAKLIVQDQGIGIARADQQRVFKVFERAASARNYGGLGLGLYIARHIIESHGGNISVVSRVGEGSRFEVDLPLIPSRSSPLH